MPYMPSVAFKEIGVILYQLKLIGCDILNVHFSLNEILSLYPWILNILSICTTKHNLNFDTFYLRNIPDWHLKLITHGESWESQLSNNIEVWGSWTESSWQNKHQCKMVEVMTLWSFTVQIIFSSFLWLGNPVPIPKNFSTWAENGQNCYLPWWVVTCFVFSGDKMWFLLLSHELQLHMVHNYIITYIRNW